MSIKPLSSYDKQLPRELARCHVAVYEWNAWHQFLIQRILPHATRIEAVPLDRCERIQSLIPDTCDVFLFHLNCTLTDRFVADRERLLDHLSGRGVAILNGRATDISKPALHRACRALGLASTLASTEGPPDERVIVKSMLNYGGASERSLAADDRRRLGLPDRVVPLPALTDYPSEYPVLPRAQVPREWWTDRQLCIERYVQNAGDRIYRAWLLGGRLSIAKAVCPGTIKKFPQTTSREFFHRRSSDTSDSGQTTLHALPERLTSDLYALSAHLDIDYGSIDIVEDDEGGYYFIDVNTTPSAVASCYDEVIEHLRSAS